MKKIFISQSNYIPWKGYFDSINLVDEWVVFDDRQFTKRDWRNRNVINTSQGLKWLTIPVETKGKFLQKINETKISDKNWAKKHWQILKTNYAATPCFAETKDVLEELYLDNDLEFLTDINLLFMERIMQFLKIKTSIIQSKYFDLHEDKTQRLINICEAQNATDYFTGSNAKAYLQPNLFQQANINIHYFDYENYPEYPQGFPKFEHRVSIVDLLFNTGSNAFRYLKSFQKND